MAPLHSQFGRRGAVKKTGKRQIDARSGRRPRAHPRVARCMIRDPDTPRLPQHLRFAPVRPGESRARFPKVRYSRLHRQDERAGRTSTLESQRAAQRARRLPCGSTLKSRACRRDRATRQRDNAILMPTERPVQFVTLVEADHTHRLRGWCDACRDAQKYITGGAERGGVQSHTRTAVDRDNRIQRAKLCFTKRPAKPIAPFRVHTLTASSGSQSSDPPHPLPASAPSPS